MGVNGLGVGVDGEMGEGIELKLRWVRGGGKDIGISRRDEGG